MSLQEGQSVTVYEDPITEKKPEGKAVIRKIYRIEGRWEGLDLVNCEVQFDNEPDQTYNRNILNHS